MSRDRLPLGKVLDYRLTPANQSTVRRAYGKWRKDRSLPMRCDNPDCQLHAPNPSWNGKAIAPIVDHIDGNRKNNRPSNLRFLCPNCDSQLPTRGGKNKGRIRNASIDSYHVVERDGQLEVKAMLTGVSATAIAGRDKVPREDGAASRSSRLSLNRTARKGLPRPRPRPKPPSRPSTRRGAIRPANR